MKGGIEWYRYSWQIRFEDKYQLRTNKITISDMSLKSEGFNRFFSEYLFKSIDFNFPYSRVCSETIILVFASVFLRKLLVGIILVRNVLIHNASVCMLCKSMSFSLYMRSSSNEHLLWLFPVLLS